MFFFILKIFRKKNVKNVQIGMNIDKIGYLATN